MRYSSLFGKTSKHAPADADSVNARFLSQGGFIAKQLAGVYNYLPLGLRVLANIQRIIREELNAAGCQEILMPALTQAESYITTGRDAMDVLFHLEGAGGTQLVLNPTHEEVVTPLVQRYCFSYQDLPVAVYQLQNKFRNEARAKSGLLRGREFNMKDLYSFHASTEDLGRFYETMKQTYATIYRRLGMGEKTIIAYASGGDFSRYSHEFQTISPVGEDTIYVCERCKVGVNKEIIADQSSCPSCGNVDLIEQRAIEVGNIFKLHQRFSSSFGFTFADAEGKSQGVEMGCYGIGPSRILGTIVELFHDEAGIIWPEAVAPFRVHLVELQGDDEGVRATAQAFYTELEHKGIEVLWDDRIQVTAGEKFADADLIGIPYRVVISKKTLKEGKIEIKERSQVAARLQTVPEFIAHLMHA